MKFFKFPFVLFFLLLFQPLLSQYIADFDEYSSVKLFSQAKEEYDAGNYDKALLVYNKIIENSPEFEPAYVQMAYCYFYQKKYQKTINILREGSEYRPVDSKHFYLMAQSYDKLKKYDEALIYISLAIKSSPDVSHYFGYRANLLMELRRYKEALDDYNMALALKPDETGYLYNRGIAYFNLKNYKAGCGDWYAGKSENESCNRMFFYKCTHYKDSELKYNKPNRLIIELPEFQDDYSVSLNEFISRNLSYPSNALINGIEGTVILKFTITGEGQVKQIAIEKSAFNLLNKEAVRVLKLTSGKWTPARYNNELKDYVCYIPVTFKICDGYNRNKDILNQLLINDQQSDSLFNEYRNLANINLFDPDVNQQYSSYIKSKNIKDTLFNPEWLNGFIGSNGYLLPETRCADKYKKIYYNKLWEITTREKAKYYRYVEWISEYKFFIGPFRDYYINGSIYSEGTYETGKRTGIFRYYYENGNIERQLNFSNGSPDGTWSFYYPTGKLHFSVRLCSGDNFDIMGYYSPNGDTLLSEEPEYWEYKYLDYTGSNEIVASGMIFRNKRDGHWTYLIGNLLQAEETWKNGKFVSGYLYLNDKRKLTFPEIQCWIFYPHSLLRSEGVLRESGISESYHQTIRNIY